MTYGNYAPFYRSGFFNTMPQMQQMPQAAENTQPYQQQMPYQQQPMQMPTTAPINDMIWVLSEVEAQSFPVAPNNSVILWDKNQDTVYIKSVNAQGMPSMRILDYTERTADAPKSPQNHVCECGKDFVKIETFEALQREFAALRDRFDEMTNKQKTKTAKAAKEVDDGE